MIKKLKAYLKMKRITKLQKEIDMLNKLETKTNNMINRLDDPSLRYKLS